MKTFDELAASVNFSYVRIFDSSLTMAAYKMRGFTPLYASLLRLIALSRAFKSADEVIGIEQW